MSKMRINKISKIIILYLLSFKINAKELVLAPYEAVIESSDSGFFFDAIVSSFNLIFSLDDSLLNIVFTSLKVSLLAVLIASFIAIPLGIIIALNKFLGKKILMTALNTLMALPTVVIGLLLYGILNRRGLLGDMDLLYTATAIIIGLCILIIPLISLKSISRLESILKPKVSKLSISQHQSYRGVNIGDDIRLSPLNPVFILKGEIE